MAILTPPPLNYQQRIRSQLSEALQLSYNDIIPTMIQLRVTLDATGARPAAVAPPEASDVVRMPGDQTFLCSEIRGHIAMNSLSTEDVAGATGLVDIGGVRNRTIAKALNARIRLVNADRDDLKVVETEIQNTSAGGGLTARLCLASLLPIAGGSPLRYIEDGDVQPLIVPANERLKMFVTLTDGNAAVGQTEYGLTLVGAFVRARGG